MSELRELQQKIEQMEQQQQRSAAQQKIDTAWQQQAAGLPDVLKLAASTEILPRAVAELMEQESVDEQVCSFLQRSDVRELLAAQAAKPAANPQQPQKAKRPSLSQMMSDIKAGTAKFRMRG